jgi:hypothetical protein
LKVFLRTMSLITLAGLVLALVPPAEARQRSPRRDVGRRSVPSREIRGAPRIEQPRQQDRAPRRAGRATVDVPISAPAPRPRPRVARPDPAPRVVYPPPPPVYASDPLYASPRAGVGVGVGSGGGVSVGGGASSSSGGSVMDSVVNGAALGGLGGPIGLAIGAGVGLLHGMWAKNRRDKQAQAETARQQEMDRQLEREVANQPHGGDEQGVRIVKDHLADEPVRTASTTPGPMVASVPPPPAEPVKAPARDAVDQDGFRPIYEGDRLVRRERPGADGNPEVILHYDKAGTLVRRQESTRADGRLDTTLFYGAGGKLERKESDTDGDGRTDVFASYDGLGNLAQMETVDGATRTRRHFDASGTVTREDELGAGGEVVASAFYDSGRLVRRELYEVDESAFNRVPLVSAQTPETKP